MGRSGAEDHFERERPVLRQEWELQQVVELAPHHAAYRNRPSCRNPSFFTGPGTTR